MWLTLEKLEFSDVLGMSQKETATEVIEGLKTDLAPFAGLV
jgi:hypothetical protein